MLYGAVKLNWGVKRMKKWMIASVLVSAVAFGGITGFYGMKNDHKVEVRHAHLNYIDDFSDKRKLVGASNNVFIGKVVSQKGNKSLDGGPETQYVVKVVKNIKGNLSGEITVNQQGGYVKEGIKEVLIIFNDDPLLEAGEKYLFATRYLASENWHTLINKFGDIKIKNDEHYNQLVKEFTEAYSEEIVPDAIKNKENYKNKEKLSKKALEESQK